MDRMSYSGVHHFAGTGPMVVDTYNSDAIDDSGTLNAVLHMFQCMGPHNFVAVRRSVAS